ncbi:LysR family transcriptional regulator [Intestinibacter sp.]|uniref:LysR family transcriptional regulator n=1 Tax=Intestinibacter sp. TaxID=1965304 RepID=UPI003F15EF98
MELKQLKTFVVVAETLSFSKTADLLNFAQSSISEQIKLLENDLNCKLFERLGRKIFLTNEGEKLLSYAEKILNLCEDAKHDLSGSPAPSGTLNIAMAETLCVYKLPEFLKKYCNSYPEVELELKIGNCEDFPDMIRKNKIDIAFILGNNVSYPDIISKILYREPLVLICSNSDDLSKERKINLSKLSEKKLILTHRECSYRIDFENYLSDIGVSPKSILSLESIEAIKQYAISGFGVSFLPRIAVKKEIENGQLVEINYDGPEFFTYAQVIYHKDKWISPALKALLNMSLEEIK